MRNLLQTMINALLSADADAVVDAEWGKPSPDGVAQRNGYWHRDLDARGGTIDVQIPKLRQETYFPGCLNDPVNLDDWTGMMAERAIAAEGWVGGAELVDTADDWNPSG